MCGGRSQESLTAAEERVLLDFVFSTQMALHLARRAEVFEQLVELVIAARHTSEALQKAGWRGGCTWPIQVQLVHERIDAVLRSIEENRLLLTRDLEARLRLLADALREACHEFVLATRLGEEDPRAVDAMRRARECVERRALEAELGIRRRMASLLELPGAAQTSFS